MGNEIVGEQHMRPEMRKFLSIDGDARLRACWNQVWVPTPASREAFKQLEFCVKAPESSKPRGGVIVGEADTGKSGTMRRFAQENPPQDNEGSEYLRYPALYILAPDKPLRTEVYKSILQEMGHPILYNAKEEDLRRHTINMIRRCDVGVIMIDELHDISRQRMSDQTIEFLRFLKGLVNATGRAFVVSGVNVVLDLLTTDTQIEGRFDNAVMMSPLKLSEFVPVLLAFEKMLPLRKPSDFREHEEVIQFLYTHSQGYIGRLNRLLYDASLIAIESGDENITIDILKRIPDRSIRALARRVA